MSIKANNDILASDFIDESEVDATPANDNGRVPKLESFGGNDRKIHPIFHPQKIEVFDTSGTWTKEDGAVKVIVELWGAGQSGGSTNNNSVATGGVGGSYIIFEIPANYLGATESVTVGVGGTPVTGSNPGVNGGNTSFGSSPVFGTAPGGGGGSPTELLPNPKIESGGSGGNSTVAGGSKTFAGGGGGGIDGTTPNPFTVGGNSVFGGDGGTANSTGNNGTAGTAPGGGGGACDNATSGAGANGRARITTIF